MIGKSGGSNWYCENVWSCNVTLLLGDEGGGHTNNFHLPNFEDYLGQFCLSRHSPTVE